MKKVTNDGDGLGHEPATPEDRAAERSRRAIERWKAKCTPERVTAVLAAKAESMRERYEVQAVMLCQVEKSVAEITDAAGVPRMMRIWYMDFGRQVYRIWRKVPSSVREMECGFVRLKWQTRGLDPAILDKVKAAIVAMLDSLD